MRTPTAHIWTLDEMKAHLIYVRDGRKVLGRQLLSVADFKGVTAASRMLCDNDKVVPVATLWLVEPGRITVDSVKDAWNLRALLPEPPPFISFGENEDNFDEDGDDL